MRQLIQRSVVLAITTAGCTPNAGSPNFDTPAARPGIEVPTIGVRRAEPPTAIDVRSEAVGCWALHDATGASADRALYLVPPIVQLAATTESRSLQEFRQGLHAARRLDAAQRPLPSGSTEDRVSWRADSLTDIVRIAFATALSGTEVLLAIPRTERRRDTISGVAWSEFDVGAVGETSAVTAVRVPCRTP